MSELQVVLNAKNKASEVLRAVGQDVKVLQDGMEKFASSVQKQTQVVEVSFSSIAKAISASAVAIAAFKAGTALMEAVGESFKQLDASNASIRGLENTLVLSGNAADDTSKKMRELANQVELATNVDANKITDIQASAFMKGIDASQIGEASKAAVGLAEAFKTDLTGGLEKAAQATKGNFDAFNALIPGIEKMATSEEKLAAVSKLATDALALKSKSAQDSSSVFDRMTVQVNNLYEAVGNLLEPFRILIYDGVAVLAGMVSSALGPAFQNMSGIVESLSGKVHSVAEVIAQNFVSAFTSCEVAIENFEDAWKVAQDTISLKIEQMRSTLEHVLTKALPEYTKWFGKNFSNIMIDSFNSVTTASSNLIKQMTGYWDVWQKTLDGRINSPIGLYQKLHEVAMGNPLLKGFNPLTTALPQVGKRVVTDTEEALNKAIKERSAVIEASYNEKMVDRLKQIDDFINSKPIDMEVNLVPSVSKEAFDRATNLPINQAVESRILVRGPGENPAIQTAANTKVIADEAKKLNENVKEVNNNFKAREFKLGYDPRYGMKGAIIKTFRPEMFDRIEWLE